MELAGRLHPMLVHFPIALALIAAGAEIFAITARRPIWSQIALANIRAGALSAAGAAVAGWIFALDAGSASDALELHRWLAVGSTVSMIVAALLTSRLSMSPARRRFYRIFLFGSAFGIGIAAHVGATLVWGADFLHL